ncbi:hypothetical protein M1N67_00675 [Peptococcaceae bacterium]|nr:hypothetical protein [Peptococcaceae bacterium]
MLISGKDEKLNVCFKVSIAVIVENAGNGADIAAPLARQLILRALR